MKSEEIQNQIYETIRILIREELKIFREELKKDDSASRIANELRMLGHYTH